MEKVVYVLGAGFSANLGLPVVSNFLEKAKDQFYDNPTKYEHFKGVLDEIKNMGIIHAYYRVDLSNIEEILSILEMGDYADTSRPRANFLDFIRDVIVYHTRPLPPAANRQGHVKEFAFGNRAPSDDRWLEYGVFASALCQVRFLGEKGTGRLNCEYIENQPVKYSVVSLNYDRVLELPIEFLKSNFFTDERIAWDVFPGTKARNENHTLLAKLHGTINENGPSEIVPPTWNKGRHPAIVAAWQAAHSVIREANHIRIIGYSLPVNDSYVRYLFKSAVMDAPNLKTIDVLCLDDNQNTTQKRYYEFITFKNFRFENMNVVTYLQNMVGRALASDDLKGDAYMALEFSHSAAFQHSALR